MVNFDIRKATADDFDSIADIFTKAIRRMDEMGIHQWDDIYPNEAILKEDMEKEQMYMAFSNQIPVSVFVLNEQQEPAYRAVGWQHKGHICVVHRLCVHPDVQGQGIGKKTVSLLEATASALQYTAIRLDVFSENLMAVSMYESMGYQYAGEVTFRKGKFYCYEKALCQN